MQLGCTSHEQLGFGNGDDVGAEDDAGAGDDVGRVLVLDM